MRKFRPFSDKILMWADLGGIMRNWVWPKKFKTGLRGIGRNWAELHGIARNWAETPQTPKTPVTSWMPGFPQMPKRPKRSESLEYIKLLTILVAITFEQHEPFFTMEPTM